VHKAQKCAICHALDCPVMPYPLLLCPAAWQSNFCMLTRCAWVSGNAFRSLLQPPSVKQQTKSRLREKFLGNWAINFARFSLTQTATHTHVCELSKRDCLPIGWFFLGEVVEPTYSSPEFSNERNMQILRFN